MEMAHVIENIFSLLEEFRNKDDRERERE